MSSIPPRAAQKRSTEAKANVVPINRAPREQKMRKALRAKPRSKGNRGELAVIELCKEYGWPARRNWQSGGQGGADIIGGPPGTSIEVKVRERLNIWDAIAQCKEAAMATDIPVVAFRRNHHQWMAAVPLEDLFDLLKRAEA